MTRFQHLAAETALKDMQRKPYFDICTLDAVISVMGVVPDRATYNALRLLHCVHYNAMPQEVLAALPEAIAKCLAVPMPNLTRSLPELTASTNDRAGGWIV